MKHLSALLLVFGLSLYGEVCSGPDFEIATIKPVSVDDHSVVPAAMMLPGGRLRISHFLLQDIVAVAYDVPYYQVTVPSKDQLKGYDIEALPLAGDLDTTPPGKYYPAITLERLRTFLCKTLELDLRVEQRPGRMYELSLDKGGIKAPEATPDQFHHPDGRYAPTHMVGNYKGMNWLIRGLSAIYLHANVIDKTGLTGTYMFDLSFESPLGHLDPTADFQNLSLTVALRRIGLRLRETTGPTDFVIVSRVGHPQATVE